MDKFELKKYLYYGIIGVISFISLVFLPMIGSNANINISLPTTVTGWIIYLLVKLLVSGLAILIYYCFMQQAKINIKDNERYIEANNILDKTRCKYLKPRAPKQWEKQQYATKGISLFITSIISCMALTEAVLTYDYMSLLTYALVIIFSVVFGIVQMKVAEAYWTNEYYQYAKSVEEQRENKITKKEIKECLQSMEYNIETSKNK